MAAAVVWACRLAEAAAKSPFADFVTSLPFKLVLMAPVLQASLLVGILTLILLNTLSGLCDYSAIRSNFRLLG